MSPGGPGLSFHDFMASCLYDPDSGYYSSGTVQIGAGGERHFWTYPHRLGPVFAWMIAERLRGGLELLLQAGPATPRLTILELGGGEGRLAYDLLEYLVRVEALPRWRAIASRLDYVISEPSAALRARQRALLGPFLRVGRCRVLPGDATKLTWAGPFAGMVLANELLDALPCEVLRLRFDGQLSAARVHVAPTEPHPEALETTGRHGRERLVPLERGWYEQGRWGTPPPGLLARLGAAEELLRQRWKGLERPPWALEICWAPGLEQVVSGVAALLRGPEGAGGALLIDYGGASEQLLQPDRPSLRAYGASPGEGPDASPYLDPGGQDLTWDVDFDELERVAAQRGLEICAQGPQHALEREGELDELACVEALARRREALGYPSPFHSIAGAEAALRRLRREQGFHFLALSGEGLRGVDWLRAGSSSRA